MHPLRPQSAQNPEQVIGLLRREHAGRLVQDQNPCAAVERLQDLHSLLRTHGQRVHPRIGIDQQTVSLAEPCQLGPGLAGSPRQQRTVFRPQHDVLEHGQSLDQHEMLVHHVHAKPQRISRARNDDLATFQKDAARIRRKKAGKDCHQRGFTGAILADDAVNAAAVDREVHRPVRVNRPEALVDAPQLDRGFAQGQALSLM